MKIYDYNHIKKLYVIGDVHGEFKELFNYIKVNGLSYNKESFKEEKQNFKESNNCCLLLTVFV